VSAISDARARLYEAVKAAVPAAPWRVFDTSPAAVTAPAVWLDSVELTNEPTAAGVVLATFPIYVVVDGTVRSQVVALDELVAALWTAALAGGGDPTSCRPVSLDVGGINLRAHVMRVDVLLAAQTFCEPLLLTSTGGQP